MKHRKRRLSAQIAGYIIALMMVVGLVSGTSLTARAATTYTVTLNKEGNMVWVTTSPELSKGLVISEGDKIKNANATKMTIEYNGQTQAEISSGKTWNVPSGKAYVISGIGQQAAIFTNVTLEDIKINSVSASPANPTVNLGSSKAIYISMNANTGNTSYREVKFDITQGDDVIELYSDAALNNKLSADSKIAVPYSSASVYVKALKNGTATLKVTSATDTTKTTECTITVSKGTQKVTPPEPIADLKCTGQPQNLVTPAVVTVGNDQEGSVKYSLDNQTWSAQIPTATDVGDYEIYYKVAENDEYEEFSGGPISATISKGDQEAPTGISAEYGQTLSDVALPIGWTWEDDSKDVGDAGKNVFKANYAGDDNYSSKKDVDVTVEVLPKSLKAATITLSDQTFDYDGSEHSVKVSSVKVGDTTLTESDYTVGGTLKASAAGNYEVTITGKGNYKDTATQKWKIVSSDQNKQDSGEVETKVEPHEDTPESKVSGMTEDVVMAVVTPQEKADIESGAKAVMTLELKNIDSTVSEGDKQIMQNVAKQTAPNTVVGMYIDISMFMKVGSNASRQLTTLNGKTITLEMDVPAKLHAPAGVRRTFYFAHIHNGVSKILAKTTNTKIPVSVGDFSTFAILYSDEVAVDGFNTSITIKQKSGKLNVSWDKVENVKKVEVYLQYCGKEYAAKPIKVTAGNKVTIKKINGKKINFKKNMKLKLVGYDAEGKIIGKTVSAHFVGKDNEKYTNAKSIKLSKSKVSVKKDMTTKVKATIKLEDAKKALLSEDHVAKFRFRTTNKAVATVDENGNIKGVATGTCTVYVYAQNALAKRVEVTVTE